MTGRLVMVIASAGLVALAPATATEPARQAGGTLERAAQARIPTEEEARTAFDRGERALQQGRAREAAEAFRLVLRFAPEDPGVHFRLGQALFMAGDTEAIEHLETARDAVGNRPEVAFLLAQAYILAERYRDAATALDAVERSAPEVADVKLARGELCYLVGRLEGARRHLRRAVDLGRESWHPPLYRLGLAAVAARDWERAVEWLERAVEAAPSHVDSWLLLATARNRAGDPAGSTAAMERAVAAEPDNVTARLVLAERYDFSDRVDALAEQVSALLELDPGNPTALLYRADRAAREGRFAEALADLDRLLASPPGTVPSLPGSRSDQLVTTDSSLRADARRRRIDLLARTGRTEEALAAARELVTDEPEMAEARFALGNLLLRQGEAEEGRRHLERFKQISDAQERRSMGESFLETSDVPELAEAELEGALEAWPRDRRAMLGLARVRRLQGRPEEALALLDRARGAPRSVESWYRERILALDALGRRADAIRVWEEGLELGLPFGPEVWRVVRTGDFGCD